jgi:hypothetical protein
MSCEKMLEIITIERWFKRINKEVKKWQAQTYTQAYMEEALR